ncbi:MAG: SMI1/KNR4 family protein [Planctomycetaceae bacterium]|nr:SMI1/KNR4 family protein [Planctomycetaceae bacterium]
MGPWVKRAVDFTTSLNRFGPETVRESTAAEPLSAAQLQALESSLAVRIPESLKHFLRTESAACCCRYNVSIHRPPTEVAVAVMGMELASQMSAMNYSGGASLSQCENFADWNPNPWWEGLEEHLDRAMIEVWSESFAFMALDCGDFLGLHTAANADDPPVVYLDHEGEFHRPIAPSLQYFLDAWEKLFYIGPEIWKLKPFLDQETGYLVPEGNEFIELQRVFAAGIIS